MEEGEGLGVSKYRSLWAGAGPATLHPAPQEPGEALPAPQGSAALWRGFGKGHLDLLVYELLPGIPRGKG